MQAFRGDILDAQKVSQAQLHYGIGFYAATVQEEHCVLRLQRAAPDFLQACHLCGSADAHVHLGHGAAAGLAFRKLCH